MDAMHLIGGLINIGLVFLFLYVIGYFILATPVVLVKLVRYIFAALVSKYYSKDLSAIEERYPNAFDAFCKENNYDDFTIKDIKRLLSLSANEWEAMEASEIKNRYQAGFYFWSKRFPDATQAEIAANADEIKQSELKYKRFSAYGNWEKAQERFAKLCLSQASAMPHGECRQYKIVTFKPHIETFKPDCYGNEYAVPQIAVPQFFFSGYCKETDLDYTYFPDQKKNFERLGEYRRSGLPCQPYVYKEIHNFLKSLNVPVQVIAMKYGDGETKALTSYLAKRGHRILDPQHADPSQTRNLVIIDGITTNKELQDNCKRMVDWFMEKKPCIAYISLLKEFSRQEMLQEIEQEKQRKAEAERRKAEAERRKAEAERRKAEAERRRIKAVIKDLAGKGQDILSNELTQKDIGQTIRCMEELSKESRCNRALREVIGKEKQRIQEMYTNEGICDDSYITYQVDYPIPPDAQDINDWAYPVVKYPKYGKIVFPYRRRAIARRGFAEAKFQKYLESVFRPAGMLVIGDCSIHYRDNRRPLEPDIALIDNRHPSICIDIEIDEPYDGKERKPIHFIGYGDDHRDMVLNNLGWIVIRFTERQAVKEKRKCAAFIARILHDIGSSASLPDSLLSYPCPKVQKRWTQTESLEMAAKKEREQYLNTKQFGETPEAKITPEDIRQTDKEKMCASLVPPIRFQENSGVPNDNATSPFKERDALIQFSPYEHIYLYAGRKSLVPVSTVISYFFKPFDALYWSDFKARQRNVPQGQILEEWDAKGRKSSEVGTFMHRQIEQAYKGGTYQTTCPFKYDGKYIQKTENVSIDIEYSQFKEFRKAHDFMPFRTEWTIYDEKIEIAGTIDMIRRQGDTYDIYDWKRSKRIVSAGNSPIATNGFGQRGIRGLEAVDDTPYWHYCLQQNLYRYILETNYGIKVGKMYLVVFHGENARYVKLDVPRMEREIETIVNACKSGKIRNYYEA